MRQRIGGRSFSELIDGEERDMGARMEAKESRSVSRDHRK